MQRQMWCLTDTVHNEVTIRLQNPTAIATHLGRRNAARLPLSLRPFNHRGNRYTEPSGNRTASLAAINRTNNTLTKIIRNKVASCMLASNPQHTP